MSDEIEIDLDDLKRRMEGAMGALKTEFASLRTGRGSASMLDPIMVEAYGQNTPINQVGTVNVARTPDGNDQCLGQVDGRQGGKGHPRIRAGH